MSPQKRRDSKVGCNPNRKGKNHHLSRGSYLPFMRPLVPLDDGAFRVLASLDDYGDDYRILTRKAACKDICSWVKKT